MYLGKPGIQNVAEMIEPLKGLVDVSSRTVRRLGRATVVLVHVVLENCNRPEYLPQHTHTHTFNGPFPGLPG